MPTWSSLGCLVLTLTISISSAGRRASSSGTWNLCFWKGTWSLLRVLKVCCVSHGGKGWSSTVRCCRYLVTSAVWNSCHKSQIHPLESWEKAQGMPAVILIKHMLLRGKTQPLLVKDRPNPALKPLRGQRPPGLVLVSHWSRTLGSFWPQQHPQLGPEHLHAQRSQGKVKPGLHSKSNGTQLNHERDAKHRFGRTKRSFHNLVLRNSITQR